MAKKKAAAAKAPAKGRTVRQGKTPPKTIVKESPPAKMVANNLGSNQPLLDPEWAEQIPEDLQQEVDAFLKAMRAKHVLAEKEKAAKERAIEKMKKYGLKRIRIDEGKQWLICEDKPGLKTEKFKPEKHDTRQSVKP